MVFDADAKFILEETSNKSDGLFHMKRSILWARICELVLDTVSLLMEKFQIGLLRYFAT